MGRRIAVVPYDPAWPADFEAERARVASVFARSWKHDDVADDYARMKLAAAKDSDVDNAGYVARKHDWIRRTIRDALSYFGDLDPRVGSETGFARGAPNPHD